MRLRYSVAFPSERERLLGYVKGRPPTHYLPLYEPSHVASARFAKRGKLASEKYDWDVLMVYVDELKLVSRVRVRL